MEQLFACAEVLGVEVRHSPMEDRAGVYYDDLKLIVIDPRLSQEVEEFTLAHELGHAYYGHRGESPLEEALADEVAAALLIRSGDMWECSGLSDSSYYAVQELGVSSRAVEAYTRIASKGSLLGRIHNEVLRPAFRHMGEPQLGCFL